MSDEWPVSRDHSSLITFHSSLDHVMICPNCGHDNLPGSEECSSRLQDLTQLDHPTAQNRVARTLMEAPARVLSPQKSVNDQPTPTVPAALQITLGRDSGALAVGD